MFRFFVLLSIVHIEGSATDIDELAQLMETDAPGSVDAFIEWGEEESKIEYYRDLIEGTQPVPPGFQPWSLSDMTNIIFYLYPPKNEEEIASVLLKAMLTGLWVSRLSLADNVASIVGRWKNLTTLSSGVFTMISLGQTPEAIFHALAPGQELRSHSLMKMTLIVSIWRIFCITNLHSPRVPSSDLSCYYDATRRRWVLGATASACLARTGLLVSIKTRERSPDISPTIKIE